MISGASIGFDTKSRRDAVATDRTVAVLKQFADLKVLVRATESAARGFALTGDPGFADEFRQGREAIPSAFAALLRAIDDPAQRRLLEETSRLVERRLAISDELIRYRRASESAAVSAGKMVADDRAMSQTMQTIPSKPVICIIVGIASARSRAPGAKLSNGLIGKNSSRTRS